jgi:hypothetical protein
VTLPIHGVLAIRRKIIGGDYRAAFVRTIQ